MKTIKFNGSDYNPVFDDMRLTGQLKDIYAVMKDTKWRTLDEISKSTGHPQASISAQLRHLRKPKFGSHEVNKQPRGERSNGLYEYQLLVNKNSKLNETYFGETN